MKSIGIRNGSIAIAFAIAGLFAVQPAAADSLTFNGMFYSSPDTVHISYTGTPTNINEYAYSGGFSMTNASAATPNTFMAYCMDIFDNMASQTYTLNSASDFVPWSHVPLNATKITALERLASNNTVTNAAQSSAFQLAVWEIVDEQSGSYSLSTGNFQAFGNSIHAPQDTIALADSWLSNLGTAGPTMKLSIWEANTPGSTQDLAVFAPVPEPETYAMMLAGLGLMGFIARRRKENEALA